MYPEEVQRLENVIKNSTEEQINEVIAKGALKMSNEQIGTVSFVFWLIYMAETGMDEAMKQAWQSSMKDASPYIISLAKETLTSKIGGERKFDIEDPPYFSDKIKVYEALFGKTKETKLFWKLNDIRNDLSHHRIDDLKYETEHLSKRTVKEKILLDYFDALLNPDLSKSTIWNSLTDEEKKEIKKKFSESS